MVKEKWIERGYINNIIPLEYSDIDINFLLSKLNGTIAIDRSVAARNLGKIKNYETLHFLFIALEKEKKLYCKIEIANAIVCFGTVAVKPLIDRLGTIGKNQHIKIDTKEFKKLSYPLPRDICARILIRIGKCSLPELVSILELGSINQISEAVDAIGFICYYNNSPDFYPIISKLYQKYKSNDLLQWKIIRAFSSFYQSIDLLEKEISICTNVAITQEIKRSLKLLTTRKINHGFKSGDYSLQ